MRGAEIEHQLRSGGDDLFSFSKMTPCNIGNPQAVGQGFMTYNREVLSSMLYPGLLEAGTISEDAKNRVQLLQKELSSPMGAYTSNSKGHMYLRKEVAAFIEERDGPAV